MSVEVDRLDVRSRTLEQLAHDFVFISITRKERARAYTNAESFCKYLAKGDQRQYESLMRIYNDHVLHYKEVQQDRLKRAARLEDLWREEDAE